MNTERPPDVMHDSSPNRSTPTRADHYQDEVESFDSKLKAIWDENLGDVGKGKAVVYRRVVVLLLSWHRDFDDLHTDKEVRSPLRGGLSITD